MTIKKSVSVDDAIYLLNELLEFDPNAIGAMVANRVPCNEYLAEHYSVQVQQLNGGYNIGLLGIINGLFGIDNDGWGAITCEFDCGNLLKFRKVTINDKENGKDEQDFRVGCHAGSDGDCSWAGCPQLKEYKVICPLYRNYDDE